MATVDDTNWSWVKKYGSRKFLLTVVTLASSVIATVFGKDIAGEANGWGVQVAGVVAGIVATVVYVITEGKVDLERAEAESYKNISTMDEGEYDA